MLNKKIHLAALVSLSTISFSTATLAMETNTQIVTAEALQNETLANVSAFQNPVRLQTAPRYSGLERKDYMRETYQDIEVTLLGPIKFGVSEDIIENHFSNVDLNNGQRIRSLNVADRFDNSTYSRATSAKTSVTFKF